MTIGSCFNSIDLELRSLILKTLGSPIRRGQKKMLPFLGNTLAKSCRKGRLQCRDFSSVSEKAVSKVYRYCFTAVFGGAGFLLGGVTTSPVSKGLREYEEYFRKGISSIASSPLSSRVKHAWEEQNKLVLGLAFIGGWFVKANINVFKRREDWYRVHKFVDDEKKRLEEKRARNEKELDDDV
ncbi:hypothetical protein HID58_000468 [Brassica napus]|uniref:Uncharacterized protein n=1 Tax=Brassica napus TaxID=3708 RepID=A0ABQ8EGM7_BRANA|nr:hypothetical protein HID58_000468 [Brassica napus]